MARLIGIAGRAGSGKSTCASYLATQGYQLDAYARVMKKAVSLLFGIPMFVLLDDITEKNKVVPYWGMTSREILQKFGTEAMRNTFGSEFWVKSFWREYDDPRILSEDLVIEDVRFPNEAEAVLKRGGMVIEIFRPSTEPTPRTWWELLFGLRKPHQTEIPLPDHLVSKVVTNNGTIEQLHLALNRAIGTSTASVETLRNTDER